MDFGASPQALTKYALASHDTYYNQFTPIRWVLEYSDDDATYYIADARIAIDQTRLLVLQAAWLLDERRPEALAAVSAIKVAAPRMACEVIDMAIQMHGGGGMSNDFPLAAAYATARSLRLADGPDEVHQGVLARLELAKYGAGKWAGK